MIRRFFMRTAARLQSFMYGRYILFGGFDKFSLLLFILGLAASFFGSLFGRGLPAILLAALSLLVYFYLIFRLFSKNISARRRENELFYPCFEKLSCFAAPEEKRKEQRHMPSLPRALLRKKHFPKICEWDFWLSFDARFQRLLKKIQNLLAILRFLVYNKVEKCKNAIYTKGVALF